MASLGSISDGVSTIAFDDDPRPGVDVAKWTYLPDSALIRGDFVPEPVWDINNGIPGGKTPPKANLSRIIGYNVTHDCFSPLHNTITGTPIGSRQFQLSYLAVNEFYQCTWCGGQNTSEYNWVTTTVTYTLDGAGNVQADIQVKMDSDPNGPDIPAVIQNIHFAELQVYTTLVYGTGLGNFNYEYDRWTPFGWGMQLIDPVSIFGNLTDVDSYFLHDANPKTNFLINQAFTDPTCPNVPPPYPQYTWYYQEQVSPIPRIIGFSRKLDGHGFLSVHGVLPSNSQPLHLGFFSPGQGIIPIVSQFAYLGYTNRTITKFTIYFLPMNGTDQPASNNNGAQRNYALSLAGYNNPTAVVPF